MAAYSLDLRKRIVEAVERQVGSKRESARLFGVHESFLYKLLRQQRERGDLAVERGRVEPPAVGELDHDHSGRDLGRTPRASPAEAASAGGAEHGLAGGRNAGVTRKKRVSAPRKPMPKREPAFRSSSRSGPALN